MRNVALGIVLSTSFFVASLAAAQSITKGTCLNRPCADGSIAAIYLHGNFPGSAKPPYQDQFSKWEAGNRQALDSIAKKLGPGKCIAVPVATRVKKKNPNSGMLYWTSSIEDPKPGEDKATDDPNVIVKAAEDACGAKKTKATALVGFSNGASMARIMCNRGFSRVVAIGAANYDTLPKTNCTNTREIKDHTDFSVSSIQYEIEKNLRDVMSAGGGGGQSGSDVNR